MEYIGTIIYNIQSNTLYIILYKYIVCDIILLCNVCYMLYLNPIWQTYFHACISYEYYGNE